MGLAFLIVGGILFYFGYKSNIGNKKLGEMTANDSFKVYIKYAMMFAGVVFFMGGVMMSCIGC